jgi:RNA polymerase sigma factor (sigma-70 family)
MSGLLGKVIRRTLLRLESAGPLTDGQLLHRFASQRDEAAFEELLRRHGPMVLRLCRRVLEDVHAAEDAFQATFVVLTRKAPELTDYVSVGGWLHRVAYHIALKARAGAGRRQARERSFDARTLEQVAGSTLSADPAGLALRPVLDEEIERLPEKYRVPVVLCCLEGKTIEAAAQQLRWATGTVASRLARGRDRLRDRLARRGVGVSAAVLAGLLGREASGAALPATLAGTAQKAAALALADPAAAAPISAQAAHLAREMLQAASWTRARWWIFLALLALASVPATIAWTWGVGRPAAPAADPFRVVWRFENGPASDLRLIQGNWRHDPQPPGAMATMPKATVLLPVEVPRRPVMMTMKVRGWVVPETSIAAGCWSDGRGTLPRKFWYRPVPWDGKPHQLRWVFADRWMLHYVGTMLHRVHEYESPYPARHIAFTVQNLLVEEIELRGLGPEELPADLADPHQAMARHQLRRALADPEAFPEK